MKRNILLILCAIFFVILFSSLASALTIDLVYEFDGNSLGTTSFGTVEVNENTTGTYAVLDFTITANTANLGGGDIHEFYFNEVNSLTGLSSTFGTPSSSPSIAGGAGASFDWEVNFGNGSPVYQVVYFTLSLPTADLTIADLMKLSSPNNIPPVLFAVHFQSTSIFNATSETVGGVGQVPIPAPIFLLGTGLVGLVGFRKRTKS